MDDQGSLPPPFGRSNAPRKKVGGPLDVAGQDERLPSELETRTAAQEAHWGSNHPDTLDTYRTEPDDAEKAKLIGAPDPDAFPLS